MQGNLTEEKIQEWLDSKSNLDSAKKLEAELRSEISLEVLNGALTGTHHKIIGDFDVAVAAKMNTKVVPSILSDIMGSLNDEELKCLKVKHELVSKNYKALPANSKLNMAIESSSGMPTVTVKPKKEV